MGFLPFIREYIQLQHKGSSSVVWENLVTVFLRELTPNHGATGRMQLLGFPIQR